VWVYTPPGYKREAGPYALLVQFDGRTYVEDFPIPIALDNLTAKGEISPMIGVFIRHDDRNKDLTCNAAFADFLAKELFPWLRERYAVSDDPAQAVVTGSSLGGLGAGFAAFAHPERFGNVLSLTGAYSYGPKGEEREWLVKQIAASDKLPIRWYLNVGRLEGAGHIGANRRMRDALIAKGYPVRYCEFTGTHTYYSRQGTFADALSHLIGRQKAELK
jgi:enterochelin esterase-like enzyme